MAKGQVSSRESIDIEAIRRAIEAETSTLISPQNSFSVYVVFVF
jgi:hypothetical protein